MTTSAKESLWLALAPSTDYPRLAGEIDVDVAILGGGMAGVTTAVLLQRDGARVAVLEARRVGSGVTGCTTAKVTALQQTTYRELRHRHGAEGAGIYAEASSAGVELLAGIAAEQRIECDFERRPAFTYAATEKERATIEDEQGLRKEQGFRCGSSKTSTCHIRLTARFASTIRSSSTQ
jgi:glycine/D-amino acid oxidase-like deaminating enzyme